MSSEPNDVSKVEGDGGGAPAEDASRLEEAFNVQRARMKELFLQKEGDLQQMAREKEQLQSEVLGLRAELQQLQTLSENQKADLLSLQLLVNETVEASSSGSEEVRKLRVRCAELEQQLAQLRHQQDVSIAPATLVRSLARKLAADSEDQPGKKPADDGDLQRYEMEISALKHKLRDTDTQLQEALKSKTANTTTTASGDSRPEPEGARRCDMCANYEQQLVHEQKEATDAREKAAKWELALKLATEELEGARSIHDETIRAWHDERASSTTALEELRAAVEDARAALDQRAAAAHGATQRALQHVTTLTVERETLQRRLDSLERDNEMLIGRFIKKAEDMQNEVIDLPDSIDELQLNTLELREKLICVQIGREEALSAEKELRTQLLEQGALFHKQEAELAEARNALQRTREELDRLSTERAQLQELGDKLRKSTDTIDSLLEDKKRMLNEQAELRSRVSALQQELDNSEAVQQDFVRLSQSLQVQLQRIREADTEVRWQDDEDVTSCPACHVALPNNKKKVHCRHCGRIFCAACAAHSVPSGPRRAPARVCAVCRTLLQPDCAPYFSTAPPHSPT